MRIEGEVIQDAEILRKLNEQIIKTKGYDFQIGHSYFMSKSKDWNLTKQMNNKIIPLLLEYYMNDKDEVTGILKSAGLNVDPIAWPLKVQ